MMYIVIKWEIGQTIFPLIGRFDCNAGPSVEEDAGAVVEGSRLGSISCIVVLDVGN